MSKTIESTEVTSTAESTVKKYKVVIEATMAMTFEVEAESLADAALSAEAILCDGEEPDSQEVALGPDVTQVRYGEGSNDFIEINEIAGQFLAYQGHSISKLAEGNDRHDVLERVEELLKSNAEAGETK